MNIKTGPSSAFVGPAVRLQSQAAARPKPFSLESQLEREVEGCVPQVRPNTAGSWNRKSSVLLRLVLLFLVLSQIRFAGAADPYAAYSTDTELSPPELNYYIRERNQREAAERQEHFRKRVAIQDAVGDDVLAAYTRKQRAMVQTQTPVAPPPISARGLLFTALAFVAAGIAVRKLAPELFDAINKKFNPWAQTAATVADLSAKVRAEDEAFAEFAAVFRTGPTAVAGKASPSVPATSDRGVLLEFYVKAPKALETLQKYVWEIGQETKKLAQHRMLAELYRDLRALKGEAGLPELLPVWQMVSALEGLVKQLGDKASEVNLSTLRTVAGGVDLLKDLCVPGMQPDLLSNPPFRLLAVDDDPISRNAVSFALKKALNAPDLAENGVTALTLATEHAYDVIFLDVQMPGMDGFEACTRIHDTAHNSTTPVVFVTCHSDFEARAHSTLSGGNDLIGKPFLTFEITVKALTLAIQGRLQKRAQCAAEPAVLSEGRTSTAHTSPAQIGTPEAARETTSASLPGMLAASSHPGSVLSSNESPSAMPAATDTAFRRLRTVSSLPTTESTASSKLSPKDLVRAFLARASTNLGPLRDLIQTVFRITDENVRQEMLADFFLRFNALSPKLESPEEHPALRLYSALEGLLTKMLANPKNCTSSTLLTVATAVDLFSDLCDANVPSDLAIEPPIRLLAVDDDPVARRAITGALQMAFEKPESVDCGEAALVLATEKQFDAIFLDVEMPGMDGFEVCLKIRETELNRRTPIVFVTGHSDFKSRSQSAISGGSDLMGKPFLPSEIKVKVLTFVLRGRLQNGRKAHHGLLVPHDEESKQAELVPA